jgi:hypothetical protein
MRIVSDNREHYDPFDVHPEYDRVRILGLGVWVGKQLA